MPKHVAMAQLSRPFQIALVAVVLLAGVWLFALQGHSKSTTGAGSSAAVVTTPQPITVAHRHTHTTRTVTSAHTSSTRTATRRASHKGSRTSTSASAKHATKTTTTTATNAPVKTATKAPAKAVTKAPAKTVTTAPATAHKKASAHSTTTLTGQHAVEAELAKGDVVVLLFWNPNGVEDVAAHQAVQQVKTVNHVAVQEAAASQVASYGSVTRGVQVYTTPTILVINKAGKALVLTGVQDRFSLQQAIEEARS